jgi:GT2 family glycosyltransferase
MLEFIRPFKSKLARAGLFDRAWYSATAGRPDTSEQELLKHYMSQGESEGLWPHPLFSPTWYTAHAKIGAAVRGTALKHFVEKGLGAGLAGVPGFDREWYLRRYPDLASWPGPLYGHFVKHGAGERRSPNWLFDPDWYWATYPEARKAPNVYTHYLRNWRAGYKPNEYFDPIWYAEQHPDAAQDPVGHYLDVGARQGLRPSEKFDTDWYFSAYPEARASGRGAFEHFLTIGAARGNLPRRSTSFRAQLHAAPQDGSAPEQPKLVLAPLAERQKDGDAVRFIFDPVFYARQYGGLADDAWAHFEKTGSRNHADPSPLFSVEWYATAASRQFANSIEAIEHYLETGAAKGFSPHPLFSPDYYGRISGTPRSSIDLTNFLQNRTPAYATTHPLFDPLYYLRCNPDVADAGLNPFIHFLIVGWREGRNPSAYFDVALYLDEQADVKRAGLNPLQHYIVTGSREGRRAHACFDTAYYLSGAADVAAAGTEPLAHFAEYGDTEGRGCHPLFDPIFYCHGFGGTRPPERPFAHFWETGVKQGRNPNPAFDVKYYASLYPDSEHDRQNPFNYYLIHGRRTHRHVHPLVDTGYQIATSSRARSGYDALTDYLQFRSKFNGQDKSIGRTFIPAPRPATPKTQGLRDVVDLARRIGKLSIVIPCYNSDVDLLKRCVDSVRYQNYPHWELILVDDGSPSEHLWPALDKLARQDSRIRTIIRRQNQGISGATNVGIEATKGSYLVFVDHDDVLTPDALHEVANRLDATNADVVYSDQVYVTMWHTFDQTFHKPQWSPALFSGVMYVGHLLVVRRSVAIAVGGMDSSFDGCQDFEFMLRVSEHTTKIEHLPRVLYHWRRTPGSVASDSDAKGKLEPKQARAVNGHFKRVGFPGVAVPNDRVPHRLRIEPGADTPKISADVIIIGNAQTADVFGKSLGAGSAIEIKTTQTLSLSSKAASASKTLTAAIGDCKAPFLLIADSNVAVSDSGWSSYLAMYASQPDVACIAPHIVDRDDLVRAAGLVASHKIGLLPAMAGMRFGDDGYAGSLCCDREVSALPAGFILIRRAALDAIGGLDTDFADIDYLVGEATYRASLAGWRNIAVASKLVEARNAYSLDGFAPSIDSALFLGKHRAALAAGDKYYNINFDEAGASYQIT